HFNRRDPAAITTLFAEAGALVEPFLRTPENQPTRHDGRAAIYEWYRETLASTPWLAMKIVEIREGVAPGARVRDWHYMHARLDAPFASRNQLPLAGGEIFEPSIGSTARGVEVEGLEAADGQSAPGATGAVPVQDAPAEAAEAPAAPESAATP